MADEDLTLESPTPERDPDAPDMFGNQPAAKVEGSAAYTVIARKYRPQNFDVL